MAKRVFKSYDQQQPTFLPPSLEELLPKNHQVRFINAIIDRLDISDIIATYPGGGASSYHPRLLLKLLIYGYVQRIYSSRRLAKATREQIPFMWLAAGSAPDFRTINHFRKHRLPGGGVKAIFTQVMQLLVEQGLVDLTEYTLDGTVLEANARKHSAVWAKNVRRYYSSATDRIEALFDEIQQLADLEDEEYGDNDLPEVGEGAGWNPERIEQAAERLSRALQEKADEGDIPDKNLSKAHTRLRKITEKELPKVRKYAQQQHTLGDRNSYSRTDPDATFMRLKDQSPFDKLLAPAYNLQMGTQNQYILGYSLHSNAADKVNMADHLDRLSFSPEWLCADAGYGTLANFERLAQRGITGVVKSPTNHARPKAYSRYNMEREPAIDSYRCPEGRRLAFRSLGSYEYAPGKVAPVRRYQSQNCSGCPAQSECTWGNNNRSITINTRLEHWKQCMDQRMKTGKGWRLMQGRGAEIEAVFGQLKQNDGLRRLIMRGRRMVHLEVGLKAIAHNLRKMEKTITEKIADATGLTPTSMVAAA